MAYNGNPNLINASETHNYTNEELLEFIKCKEDPIYFLENYVKIVNIDLGLINFKPYKYQKKIVKTIIENRYTMVKLPRQSGKCCFSDTYITVRNKITGEIYDQRIGDLYEKLFRNSTRKSRILESTGKGLSDNNNLGERLFKRSRKHDPILHRLSDTVERKFIDSIDVKNLEVLSDKGFVPFSSINKTIKYQEWELKTKSKLLICADNHIVFKKDFEEIFVKNLKEGDLIQTENGLEVVESVVKTDRYSNMYDLSVDTEDHRYYTNGILSHNSTIVVALMIWLVLFNENYNIAILANKADQSRELLGRIQTAYEHMPKWLQQPVEEWNKGSIELANGSKILAAATSASAVRGKAFNFIYLDEFAFVPRNIQDQFFTSVYPTISSGNTSKIAITSTPNGMDLFYKLWVQSENNKNDYKRIEIHWSDTPGRDEKWREEQIRNTSEIQFQQEFECVSGDTMIEVLDTETNEVKKITIEELYNLI